MKKITTFLIILGLVQLAYAQKDAIVISKTNGSKQVVLKDNRRIRIKTVSGDKISGRLRILSNDSIQLKDQSIAIQDIQEIKKNPLVTSVLTSGFLIYGGAITAGIGVITGIFVQPSGYLLTIPASGMIYAGAKSPNLNRKYKRDRDWTYEPMIVSP